MKKRTPTPSHTVGPFFPARFFGEGDYDLTFVDDPAKRAQGQKIYIGGNIYEAERVPRWNCMVEIWQPDAGGCFNHPNDPRHSHADPNFMGWGRRSSDDAGWYDFVTVKPGGYTDPLTGFRRAPHIDVAIMSSGLMRRLVTTLFFPDEPANAEDPVFNAIPEADVRERLILKPAKLEGAPADATAYRLDIVLQGDGETPFFVD
ncbi:MAG: protocatechuate 3,4-dioxygenase subunit alpha [Betaproteobacteria bacterium]|nr:protocatechuate 3,4-dioxygenase subunit alpha [Betaproteobacteria bacterium]